MNYDPIANLQRLSLLADEEKKGLVAIWLAEILKPVVSLPLKGIVQLPNFAPVRVFTQLNSYCCAKLTLLDLGDFP
jgi:hypothetical protein